MILEFARGKRFLMRAPLRVAYALKREESELPLNNLGGGRRSSDHLKNGLHDLEVQGMIIRYPGYIEILENYDF